MWSLIRSWTGRSTYLIMKNTSNRFINTWPKQKITGLIFKGPQIANSIFKTLHTYSIIKNHLRLHFNFIMPKNNRSNYTFLSSPVHFYVCMSGWVVVTEHWLRKRPNIKSFVCYYLDCCFWKCMWSYYRNEFKNCLVLWKYVYIYNLERLNP